MNIQDRKITLAEKLFKIRNENLLKQIETLVDNEMIVAYTTKGEPLTLMQYKTRLDKAEQQVAEGRTTSQEDFEKESEQW